MIDFSDPIVFLPISAVAIFLVLYFVPQIRSFLVNDEYKPSVRCFVMAAVCALFGVPATVSSGIWLHYAWNLPEVAYRIAAGACLGLGGVVILAALVTFCLGIQHNDKGR